MKSHHNEQGFVSIIVSIVVISILSLITISFAYLMRREARQSLDRQLSSQAFYAAESGINAAINTLKANPGYSANDCASTGRDLGNELSYTCVLVDNTPDSLEYSPVSTETSTVIRLDAPNATAINISWQPSEGKQNFVEDIPQSPVAEHNLPVAYSNSPYATQVKESGLIRLSLIPVSSTGISRQGLIDQTQTMFLFPNKNATADRKGAYAYSNNPNTQGGFVNSECNPNNRPYNCNIQITNLPAGINTYYLRIKSVYTPARVQVSANNPDGGRISFGGVQAVIDSTGKANDVLRRVQVRVPLSTDYVYPEFGLETTDTLCKKLSIYEPTPGSAVFMDRDECDYN
jgi:Tfp pilus assembly protein PilX